MSERMVEKKIPSALPIYFSAAAFVVGALIFPVYSLWGLLATAALSAAVYIAAKRKIPPRIVMTPAPATIFATGEQSLDLTLTEAEKDLKELAALNSRIPDEKLSADIARMEKAGASILDYVAKNPGKAKNIRKFSAYYLPTSVKLLKTYAELAASGAQGENARSLMAQVQQNTATIAAAFEAQLDALFADKVLDVSADATVLDGMLRGDGLTGGDAVTSSAKGARSTVAETLARDFAAGAVPGARPAQLQRDLQADEPVKPELKL